MVEEFEAKKQKFIESSQAFQEELKKFCVPAVDEDAFQRMVERQYDVMRKEYSKGMEFSQNTSNESSEDCHQVKALEVQPNMKEAEQPPSALTPQQPQPSAPASQPQPPQAQLQPQPGPQQPLTPPQTQPAPQPQPQPLTQPPPQPQLPPQTLQQAPLPTLGQRASTPQASHSPSMHPHMPHMAPQSHMASSQSPHPPWPWLGTHTCRPRCNWTAPAAILLPAVPHASAEALRTCLSWPSAPLGTAALCAALVTGCGRVCAYGSQGPDMDRSLVPMEEAVPDPSGSAEGGFCAVGDCCKLTIINK